MKLILKKNWDVVNADSRDGGRRHVVIPAGTHEVEVIPNPCGSRNGDHWIVLKGTKIGMCERCWRNFADPHFGDSQVVIEDEDKEREPVQSCS